ncbi:unnamed protein product [Cylicocyclus nassatus]|uniref:Uncharacterized protein n=1 Tax=Cylicocyclus nassatus TaxID=53992 RepID=A0AA36GLG6_CYLNA|nr:unnamed protein product [Cylicocyclus nassatus]
MDEPKEMPTKSIFREVRNWFRARTRRELIAMGVGAALATFTTIVVVRRYQAKKTGGDERAKVDLEHKCDSNSELLLRDVHEGGIAAVRSYDSMRSGYKSERSEKKSKKYARPPPTVLPPMPPPPPDTPPEPIPTQVSSLPPPEPVAPTRLIATTPPHRIRSLPPLPATGGSRATRLPSAPVPVKTSVPDTRVHVDKGSISKPLPARRRNRSMSRTGSKEGVKTAQNVGSKEAMKTAQDLATARKETSMIKTAKEETKK